MEKLIEVNAVEKSFGSDNNRSFRLQKKRCRLIKSGFRGAIRLKPDF
jgi:hypothetical protein